MDGIDESGAQPTLTDEPRISVLDVRDVYLTEGESIDRTCEVLGIGGEQVHAALGYYAEHREEMEQIREENEKLLDETVESQ